MLPGMGWEGKRGPVRGLGCLIPDGKGQANVDNNGHHHENGSNDAQKHPKEHKSARDFVAKTSGADVWDGEPDKDKYNANAEELVGEDCGHLSLSIETIIVLP